MIFYRVCRNLLFLFFKIFFRMDTIGLENVPKTGGVILCANHIGAADPFSVGSNISRKVNYMAKQELFNNKMLGWLLGKLGAFPIKRGTADTESIKNSLRLLKNGEILGIYPEGHRNKTGDGEFLKPLPGVAYFAVKTDAPIVPVAIWGNYKLFSSVHVKFGKPFYLEHENRKYTNDELSDMSLTIMQKIRQLLEE